MAKKVNKKFLVGLTVALGGIAVAVFALVILSHHNARYYVRRGQAEEAKGNLATAASMYALALNKDGTNKELYVKLGDIFSRLAAQDPITYLGKSRQAWANAVQIDPAYKPALERLRDFYIQEMKTENDPGSYAMIRTLAEQGLRADPGNATDAAYIHIAPLLQWLHGAALTDKVVDQHVQALVELARKNPDEADVAFYASQARLKRARALVADGNSDRANAIYDQIAALHAELVKARPQSAEVQLRAFQIYSALAELDGRADAKAKYQDLRRQTITAAQAAAKPSDEMFDDVQHYYAYWLASQGTKRDDLEKLYRAWVKARPADQRARIELAEFLGAVPAQRAEAIRILSEPVPPDPTVSGFSALQVRILDRATLIDLNSFRADDARAVTGDARKAIVAKIDADLDRISAMGFGEDPAYLKLRGKVQMLQGDSVEAVKTFERARTLLGSRFDGDLASNLEQAYLSTAQTGSAMRLVEDLVSRAPGSIPARAALAELYLGAGQTDQAAQQVEELKKLAADSPQFGTEIARLHIAVLSQGNHPQQARRELDALPETTRADRLVKGRLAGALGDSKEAERLFKLVLRDSPADADAIREMVDLHLRMGQKEQAQEVVTAALKHKPGDKALTVLADRLAVSTTAQLRKWEDEVTEQLTDPFVRALRKATLAMNRGEFDEAARQLDAADKLRANDAQTADLRYQWYLRQNKLDEAAVFVERAARLNLDRMGGLALRTRFALDRHDPQEAIRWGNDLVGKYKEFAENWLLLGEAQQAAGRPRDAINSYNLALARQPNNLDALRLKAACLDQLGQITEEKGVIDFANRLAPDNSLVRDLSVNFELHHGDPEKVIAICTDMLRQDPRNPNLYAAVGQACEVAADTKYANNPDKARQFLNQARDTLTQGMDKFAGTPELRKFYPVLASVEEQLGNTAGAEKLLRDFGAQASEKDDPEPSRELAMFLERHKRPNEAERAWRDAYARSNDAVVPELELASFLIRSRRVDDALKVLEANASDARVMDKRIEALMGVNRLPEARTLVNALLAAKPGDSAGLAYRGLIEFAQGDLESATKDFSYLRDRDPDNVQFRLWLAQVQMARGRRDAAAVELETALSSAPTRDDIRLLLLNAYSSNPNPRWEDFDRVVQDALANPQLRDNPAWPQVYARGLSQRGLFPRAIEQIDAARKLAPNDPVLRQDYLTILAASKNWQGVLDETGKEIAQGHKEPILYQQRAAAKAGLNDTAGAAREIQDGLDSALSANNPAAAANVVRAAAHILGVDQGLALLDKLPEGPDRQVVTMELDALKRDWAAEAKTAEAMLNGREKLSPEAQVLAMRAKGDAYMNLAQFDVARQTYEQLLKIRPDDIATLNNLAYLLAENLKQPQQAKEFSGRAYALAEKRGGIPDVADTHGWVLTLCGGPDAAKGINVLQKLVEANDSFTKARYHLLEAYVRQGRTEDAQRQLAVVQDQISKMQKNHQAVDDELQAGVEQASKQLHAKEGAGRQANSD